MKIRRYQFLIMGMLLVFVLSACVRPASQAPKSAITPTTAGGFPLPGTNDDVMSELEKAATQTLVAMQAATTPEATATSAEVAPVTPEATEPAEPTTAPPVEAATATPIPFPTATPGIPKTYTLQRGEHPYCIARRFDVNPNEMLRLSGLSQRSTFYAGMVLTIPQSGKKFPAQRALRAHPTTYNVSAGETIYSIACKFGDVDPNAIAAANGLQAPYKLSAGQQLQIP